MLHDVHPGSAPFDHVDITIDYACRDAHVHHGCDGGKIDDNEVVSLPQPVEQPLERLGCEDLVGMSETRLDHCRQECKTGPIVAVNCVLQVDLAGQNLE